LGEWNLALFEKKLIKKKVGRGKGGHANQERERVGNKPKLTSFTKA